jgi:hypothetical protein
LKIEFANEDLAIEYADQINMGCNGQLYMIGYLGIGTNQSQRKFKLLNSIPRRFIDVDPSFAQSKTVFADFWVS